MKNKILVTLATGKTGRETTLQLLEDGLAVKIRAGAAGLFTRV